MIDYFWFPYLFFNFLDGITFLNCYESCSFVEWYMLTFFSCFISVSAFILTKLKLLLYFSFKSLVTILLIFCRSDSAMLNFSSRPKSNAQFSVVWIMYMYGFYLFSIGTNLGPKFKSFILFSSNSSPVRFTMPSLIIDRVVSIGKFMECSLVFIKLVYFEIKSSFFFIKCFPLMLSVVLIRVS